MQAVLASMCILSDCSVVGSRLLCLRFCLQASALLLALNCLRTVVVGVFSMEVYYSLSQYGIVYTVPCKGYISQ